MSYMNRSNATPKEKPQYEKIVIKNDDFHIDEVQLAPIPSGKFNNLTGRKLDRISVLGYAGRFNAAKAYFWCKCECGKIFRKQSQWLTSDGVKSCGCYYAERKAERSAKSLIRTTEYRSFQHAKERCNNKRNKDYHYYGGRGIQFRLHSVEAMIEEIGMKPTPQHTIDRIDNNKHYETGNIKWSTRHEQSNNRRNNVAVTINGETRNVAEWQRINNLPIGIAFTRMNIGWCAYCSVTIQPNKGVCYHKKNKHTNAPNSKSV